jgi:photosystem II stability/assembly factor-like uncharacterized protein
LKSLAFFILFIATACGAQPQFPPERPNPMPPFQIPRSGGSLDDGWQYMQTLADADSGYPELLNAYPVQMTFTHGGRGFLATLHTIFYSDNGGRTWRNLDPFPPPAYSDYSSLRAPVYITGIAPRPVLRPGISADSLFLSTFNAANNRGRVRMVSYAFDNYYLLPDTLQLFTGPHWLTGIALPDSDNIYALAGYDRKIYYRDSLSYPVLTRWDSLYATTSDQWVPGIVERVDSLMIAVGGEQWISRDGGYTWTAVPAADPLGDSGVSFADTLHGLVGGGRLNPSSGWARYTTDGGFTWSDRALSTYYPMRCVEMVTPDIGFAAGGNYNVAAGEIWKTTDGGQSWNLDATVNAEITALGSERISGAYVNVIAAGVFPDFHGGVWRNQLYLPDASGAVLVIDPDSLDFGVVARGDTGYASAVIHNAGNGSADLFGAQSSDPAFSATNISAGMQIAPGADLPLDVIFTPPVGDSPLEYTAGLTLLSADGSTEVVLRGSVPLSANEPSVGLPQSASLTVWPNPGNAVFQIRFELSRTGEVALRVYDVTGRLVTILAQGKREPGQHVVAWNARDAASGIYFVRLEAGDVRVTTKLLLVK